MPVGKILVVDDAPAVLEALAETLVRLGVEREDIRTAADGRKAMAVFQADRPTVVFMDIDLPYGPGHEVTKKILAQAPSTKVVVMTGLSRDDPKVRAAVSAGAYEVIEKPLRLARLRQVLDLIDSEEKGLRRL